MKTLRLPALSCALAFLLCELISRPFAEMGICDDWSYVRTAQLLASTGHILYNGWGAPILGWQLFLAGAFIKLFGFSFTSVRMSAWLVGTVGAFLIQRIFVRSGISERNAVIGTLAVVLSPLYLMLSATFMTDMFGMFAIVVCVYGCVRALQSASQNSAIGWIWFAVVANAIAGSSRQIAWLGLLVVVPSTLWLLRAHRRVLVAGTVAVVAGCAFIAVFMHWFQQQPYSIPEHVFVPVKSLGVAAHMLREVSRCLLEIPFLLMALFVAFLPELRRGGRKFWLVLAGVAAAWILIAIRISGHRGPDAMLQPLVGDWIGLQGYFNIVLQGQGPQALGLPIRWVLTAVSLVSLLCFAAFIRRVRRGDAIADRPAPAAPALTWSQIGVLVVPFALASIGLMIPRATALLFDRYLLPLTFVAAIGVVRAYQDFVAPRLPAITSVVLAIVAVYGIAGNHDMFALDRARIQISNELRAAGVAENTVDQGFEVNHWIEIHESGYINDEKLINPPNSYVKVDPFRGWTCEAGKGDTDTGLPHFLPTLGVAFQPDACRGRTDFAPVSYFRWQGLRTATLYVVKYGPRGADR